MDIRGQAKELTRIEGTQGLNILTRVNGGPNPGSLYFLTLTENEELCLIEIDSY